MARILVRVASNDTEAAIKSYLESEGHEVVADPNAQGEDTRKLAEEILLNKPELVIMDYVAEDALSVKAMQQVHAKSAFVGFLFLLDQDPGCEHVILAVNEGAAALLTIPVSQGALANYVARALVKRQTEITKAEELARYRELTDKEKAWSMEQAAQVNSLKSTLNWTYRTINHILAVASIRPKPTVLLVSDSAYQVELLRKQLEEHNFNVVTAADGEKGLETARAEKPRVIVADLEMPGLNGVELCRAVKNDDSLSPNHFIISTASRDKMEIVRRPENKVDDCLRKPTRAEEFQEFVARVAMGLAN
jgi:DNA-binding response OmpR family regulator